MNLDKIEIRNWSHDKKIYNSMLIVKFIILLFLWRRYLFRLRRKE